MPDVKQLGRGTKKRSGRHGQSLHWKAFFFLFFRLSENPYVGGNEKASLTNKLRG